MFNLKHAILLDHVHRCHRFPVSVLHFAICNRCSTNSRLVGYTSLSARDASRATKESKSETANFKCGNFKWSSQPSARTMSKLKILAKTDLVLMCHTLYRKLLLLKQFVGKGCTRWYGIAFPVLFVRPLSL